MALSILPRQADYARFIAGHIEARGCAPSCAEIVAGLGVANKGTVHRALCDLEEREVIERTHRVARAIRMLRTIPIPRAPDGAPLYFVPFDRLRTNGGEVE